MSKYEPPVCQFETDSNYRMTYLGHSSGGPPQIVRPPPSSIQLFTSEAPFDGRTNYRDEFTGHQEQPTVVEQSEAPDVAQPEDTVLGFAFSGVARNALDGLPSRRARDVPQKNALYSFQLINLMISFYFFVMRSSHHIKFT